MCCIIEIFNKEWRYQFGDELNISKKSPSSGISWDM